MKYLKLFENKIDDENILDNKIDDVEKCLKEFDIMLIKYIVDFGKNIGCVYFGNVFKLSAPNLYGLSIDGKIQVYNYFKNIYEQDQESLLLLFE